MDDIGPGTAFPAPGPPTVGAFDARGLNAIDDYQGSQIAPDTGTPFTPPIPQSDVSGLVPALSGKQDVGAGAHADGSAGGATILAGGSPNLGLVTIGAGIWLVVFKIVELTLPAGGVWSSLFLAGGGAAILESTGTDKWEEGAATGVVVSPQSTALVAGPGTVTVNVFNNSAVSVTYSAAELFAVCVSP